MELLECPACHAHVAGPAPACPLCRATGLQAIQGDFSGALSADGQYRWDGAVWQSTVAGVTCPNCNHLVPPPIPANCPFCHQVFATSLASARPGDTILVQVMRTLDAGLSWHPISLVCPSCSAALSNPMESSCEHCGAEIGDLRGRLQLLGQTATTRYKVNQTRTRRVVAKCPQCGSGQVELKTATKSSIEMHCRACLTDFMLG